MNPDEDDDGGLSNIQIEFTMEDSEHEHEGEAQEGAQRGTRGRRASLLRDRHWCWIMELTINSHFCTDTTNSGSQWLAPNSAEPRFAWTWVGGR